MSERGREYARQWREENKQKIREKKMAYYRSNLDECQRKNRERYARDRIARCERERRRRLENHSDFLAKAKAARAKNPELYRAWQKEHKRKNPNSWRLYGTRKSAKILGVSCDLDLKWFSDRIQSGHCEMSGLPFDLVGKRTPNSPSVDRIDPFGPYSKSNCRIILWWINRALSNLGEDYAIMVFENIIEKRKLSRRVA